MKIVVLDGYTLNPGDNPWDPLAALGDLTGYDRTNPEDVLERSRGAEILITNKTRLNADTLAALPDLRCIGVIATGYDVVDIAAAGKRGIPVMNVVNYGTEAVAQHAFALLLELCRRTALHDAGIRSGRWAAGEWHVLRRMLPPFEGKRVLDLGCGFGWHCRYAVEQGAASVVGVDLSERMLAEARAMTDSPAIQYLRMPIEAIDFPADSFDVAISSLAFHYIESFGGLCAKVNRCLSAGGHFVFSVEHPVFTAQGSQEWHCDAQGNHLHWPVDSYFSEGVRKAGFLGEEVMKYHKTLTAYVNGLLQNGFELLELVEPQPEPGLLEAYPEIMRDELRRPMMLLVSARKR